ncbi:hypothetical protein [Amycolatopsis sp. NBC_01286]|uniref:hypothetical protein n=1 Tax=Amycolatopsis sp. NBC_01286 TaxID=2903560 RepID=UPI002E0D6C25|nr:hypothetical protein OG570_39600 [Amycolatopsis sp. NBC_01286]
MDDPPEVERVVLGAGRGVLDVKERLAAAGGEDTAVRRFEPVGAEEERTPVLVVEAHQPGRQEPAPVVAERRHHAGARVQHRLRVLGGHREGGHLDDRHRQRLMP